MAQSAGTQSGGTFELLIPLVLMFGIFYFLLIRPQQKKAKEHKNLIEALKKGDEVITTGGLVAKITAVGEGFLTCELADKVEVKLQINAVATVLPKGTIKNL